jgi:hypothetical protein
LDYEQFDTMSPEEAAELLRLYRATESQACVDLLGRLAYRGVRADYSVDSVPAVLVATLNSVGTVPIDPDPTEPEWIRNSAPYQESLFDFDERSKPLVLAASYYLGESFVRSYPQHLSWATGDTDYAGANQPVVTGFRHGLQMSTIAVTESLFSRVIKDPTKLPDIPRTVAYWAGLVD